MLNESSLTKALDSNVENSTELTVVFPDGALNESNRGHSYIEEYKTVLDILIKEEGVVKVCMPRGKFVWDFEGFSFLKLFPQLFPYGLGGPTEKCILNGGSIGRISMKDYLQHITSLSHGGSFPISVF